MNDGDALIVLMKTKKNEMNTAQIESRLDATDWQVLAELRNDARVSYADLSRRVGLSPPAVAERVRRLEAGGVIRGYTVKIDPAALGLRVVAFIRLSVVGNRTGEVARALNDVHEVVECYRATGADCFVMKARVASIEHLEQVVDRLTEFGQATTSVVLSKLFDDRPVTATPMAPDGRARNTSKRRK